MKKKTVFRMGALLVLVIALGITALLCESCSPPKETITQVVPIVEDDQERENEISLEEETHDEEVGDIDISKLTLVRKYEIDGERAQELFYKKYPGGYLRDYNNNADWRKEMQKKYLQVLREMDISFAPDTEVGLSEVYLDNYFVISEDFIDNPGAHHYSFTHGNVYILSAKDRVIKKISLDEDVFPRSMRIHNGILYILTLSDNPIDPNNSTYHILEYVFE